MLYAQYPQSIHTPRRACLHITNTDITHVATRQTLRNTALLRLPKAPRLRKIAQQKSRTQAPTTATIARPTRCHGKDLFDARVNNPVCTSTCPCMHQWFLQWLCAQMRSPSDNQPRDHCSRAYGREPSCAHQARGPLCICLGPPCNQAQLQVTHNDTSATPQRPRGTRELMLLHLVWSSCRPSQWACHAPRRPPWPSHPPTRE